MEDNDYKFLEYVCPLIVTKINQHKVISEKTLLDFGITIANILHKDTISELPNFFDTMLDRLEDYWYYSAYKDEDDEVAFSYVRALQIARMLTTFLSNNKIQQRITTDAEKYKDCKNIIKVIYEHPGESKKFLFTILNAYDWSIVEDLINDGYIYLYPVGDIATYDLSGLGLKLYNKITETN